MCCHTYESAERWGKQECKFEAEVLVGYHDTPSFCLHTLALTGNMFERVYSYSFQFQWFNVTAAKWNNSLRDTWTVMSLHINMTYPLEMDSPNNLRCCKNTWHWYMWDFNTAYNSFVVIVVLRVVVCLIQGLLTCILSLHVMGNFLQSYCQTFTVSTNNELGTSSSQTW